MPRPAAIPFAFADFLTARENASTPSERQQPPPTDADVDAAYASGRRDALKESASCAEALTAERVTALADALRARVAALEADATGERRALLSLIRKALQRIVRATWRNAQFDEAVALVDRLIAADSRPIEAVLHLSPESIDRIGSRLAAALEARGATTLKIAADPQLAAEDLRLEWRGGAASVEIARAFEEIDRLIAAAAEPVMEQPQ
jgi:flagellar biosynthesis/type III secretory pathway protein FliH